MGSWRIEREHGSSAILIVFAGDMVESEGKTSAAKCKRLMGHDVVDFYADFSELMSYEPGVRKAWQDVFIPHRKQIRSIHLLTHRALVKMGVQAFAMLIGLPVTTYKTLEEFYAASAIRSYAAVVPERRAQG